MLEILDEIYARTKGQRDEDGNKIPPEKTIIFSQFTTMLDMVEPFLLHAGIRYTRCQLCRRFPLLTIQF
jgi:SNF2 family DNA or RNA helicase